MDPPPDHGEDSYRARASSPTGRTPACDITGEIMNATGGTPLP